MKVWEIIGSIVELIIKVAVLLYLVTLIYKGAIMAYDYGYRVFTEEPVSVGEGRIISVEIKEDASAMDIGEMLQQKGLIRDARIFFLQERLSEYHGKEVPGIYDLSTAMRSTEMLEIICPEKEKAEEPEESYSEPAPVNEEEPLEIISEDEDMTQEDTEAAQ